MNPPNNNQSPPPPEFEREAMQIARQDDPVHHWLMDHGFLKNEDARKGSEELLEIVRHEFQERIDAAETAASMLRASRDAAVEQEQTSRAEANRLRAELSAMMDLKSTLQDYLIAVEKAIGWKDDEEHNFRALPDWIRHRLNTLQETIISLEAQIRMANDTLKHSQSNYVDAIKLLQDIFDNCSTTEQHQNRFDSLSKP